MDILIVDDDHSVASAYARILERSGYVVKTVNNGLAAVAEVQQQPFRAILCDIRMPFLEGRSFFHHLQEEFTEMADRVIFITGIAHEPETRQFLDRAGRPFLTKPIEHDDLLAAVRQIADATP